MYTFIKVYLYSTWQERTAQTFWMMLQRLPYQSKPVVCWKLVTVIHKVSILSLCSSKFVIDMKIVTGIR